MPFTYEYWQHRATGEVWAVKMTDGRLAGVAQIAPREVNEELLPYLHYSTDIAEVDKRLDDFRRIDGRKVA